MIISLFAFVIAISVLIAFHEWGHFLLGRWCGVKVLVFSIGFGPAFYERVSQSGVCFKLSVFPLGGYVRFLDEREGPVPADLLDQTFNRQPVWKRMLIVAAGPAFNLLLAVIMLISVHLIGTQTILPITGEITADSRAEHAGLRTADQWLSVAGQNTVSWRDVLVQLALHQADGRPVAVTVQNAQGNQRTLQIDLRGLSAESGLLRALGMEPYLPPVPPVIAGVARGGPAEKAGLRPGDTFLSINDIPIKDWNVLTKYIRVHPDQNHRIQIKRGHKVQVFSIQPTWELDDGGERVARLGIQSQPIEWPARLIRTHRDSPWHAVVSGCKETISLTQLTLGMVMKAFTGQLSMNHLSGPIGIAKAAGQTASIGFTVYLQFLAMISVSLAVLNALPIPLLDGGHLFYYLIEAIRGRPLSIKAQEMGFRGGFVFLLGIMGLSLYNDISKLW